jgi:hypothetical protein
MSGIWYFGNPFLLWRMPENYVLPVLLGLVWSFVLAGHAYWTYRRSAARVVSREEAVVAELQQFVQQSDMGYDQQSLIEMHQQLEDGLEAQGHAVIALTVFAVVNVLIWIMAVANIGSSFAFQMNWPIALVVIGGINAFSTWQRQKRNGQQNWFTRIPLRHLTAYVFGVLALAIIGMLRLVNYWDVNTVVELWTWLLLAHVGFSVIVQPLWQRLSHWLMKPAKRKRSEHMLLDDEGELVDIIDDDLDSAARLATEK